jgi:uncharacterized protein (TIRG00374 family)
MYRKRLILFSVSVLLLAALFYTLDYNEFLRVTSNISFKSILVLVFVQFMVLFLNALKWYVVIRRYAVSFKNVLYTSLIGVMVNSLTPASYAGGEPVRVYVISKIDKIKPEKALATVLVDLFLTLVPVLLMTLFAIVLVFINNYNQLFAWALSVIVVFIIALLAASFGLIFSKEPSLKFLYVLLDALGRIRFLQPYVKAASSQIDELFFSFRRGIKNTMTDGWSLFVGVIISCLIWVLSVVRVYLIFAALGVPIDPSSLIIAYTVLIGVGVVPFLPGALGVWEWAGTGVFSFFGVPVAAAAAVVVIDRILFFWIPIFTGFIASLHIGLNATRLIDEGR